MTNETKVHWNDYMEHCMQNKQTTKETLPRGFMVPCVRGTDIHNNNLDSDNIKAVGQCI